ncbi:MarR family transcriptional regulator [Stigmatella sp. ncwal1]|uniref:MarR family transcriptional regulator n=1 Tax=Stigmatella ashevillensis TaxID=2995309 RepID=A0ABT5DHR1_9BACT|nr:MarR family transcriptional regulator [Stigmatella ashevillena]MDC0713061.1 MarR family transcriptional regulator [Stigmatella ashevillena]
MSRNIPVPEEGPTSEVSRLLQLVYTLGRRRSLRDPIAGLCEQFQFTPPQVHALLWLGQDGALTMGELARRLGITEKTVTGVVDRLEREGHLQRERVHEDRRVVRCRLTDSGQQTSQQLHQLVNQALSQLLEMLDSSDRKALFRIIEKLVRRLDTSPEPTPAEEESA